MEQNLDFEEINWDYEPSAEFMLVKSYNYEEMILSCLLQNDKLFKELVITENDFKKYKKIFVFFKAFYDKFGFIDYLLMVNKLKNTKDKHLFLVTYTKLVLLEIRKDKEYFELLQNELLEYNKCFEQEIKEEENKKELFDLFSLLINDKISLKQFYEKTKELEKCILED